MKNEKKKKIDARGFDAGEIAVDFRDLLLAFVRKRLSPRSISEFGSEDIVQSVWCSYLEYPRRIELTLDETRRWLCAVAKNKLCSGVRKAKPKLSLDDSLQSQRKDSPEEYAIFYEMFQQLLKQLPPSHQRILKMRVEGYRLKEIAEEMNVSISTVERAIVRCRQYLKQQKVKDSLREGIDA